MSTPSLLLSSPQAQLLREQARQLPSVALQEHELAALELLLEGALAPLDGFSMRAGPLRPILPLYLTDPAVAGSLDVGAQLAVQDREGVTLAVMQIEQLQRDANSLAVGGQVRGLQMPARELFAQFRMRVAAIRDALSSTGSEQNLCVHVRGELDEQSATSIEAFGKQTFVLLRVLDSGDPDQAHLLKRALRSAERLRTRLGVERCLIVISPDPSKSENHARQMLDECYARNAGCPENVWLGVNYATSDSRQHGTCIFFTGLSGSGKSTLARALHANLVLNTERAVTLLDGDVVRQHLSAGLGYSRQDRDLNVLRIGYVASRIVMHGGLVICAPIAPYAKTRAAVRMMSERYGRFIEVHVSTALGVCEARDRKGLYAKARAGEIKEFTGISDPYEIPVNAEITIDTEVSSVLDAVHQITTAIMQHQQSVGLRRS